jgi:tetratricopeptide (TPR) repeat protein
LNAHRLFSRCESLIPLLLVGLLSLAVYWPGLGGSFFFDDEPNILWVEAIRLDGLSVDGLLSAWKSGHAGPLGRPVSQLSFAINYFLDGFSPFYFKLTNLAIHLLNGILVFLIARRLIMATLPGATFRETRLYAGLVAAAWLLHPIQVPAVLYVVQRMTSLSALFLLSALLLHITARQRERLGPGGGAMLALAWGVFWPLSIYSKETGLLLPGFVAAYELIVRCAPNYERDFFGRALLWVVGAAGVAAAVYLVLPAAHWMWAGYELRGFSPTERLMSEARVLWLYLDLIYAPYGGGFSLYHDDVAISTGLLMPWTTLPAVIGILALIAGAWWGRSRFPLVSFGITWFLVGHGLESTVLPLELAHEHRNYVPLLGALLAFVPLLAFLTKNRGAKRTAGISMAVVFVAYLGFLTALRSHQWSNEILRTQLETQYHPDSPRANYEAALALVRQAGAGPMELLPYVMARKHYERAGKLDPDFKLGLLGLMQLNCKTGKEVEEGWVDELARRLEKTPFSPADRNLLYSLKEMAVNGVLCLKRQDVQTLFAASLANDTVTPPVRAMLYSWFADYLLLREKDLSAAQEALGQSLVLAPNSASNQLKWAQLLFLQGRYEEARRGLAALQDRLLSRAEARTKAVLLACLAGESQCRLIP